MIISVQNLQHYKLSVLDLDEVYFLAWNNAVDFAIEYNFDCRTKIEYVLVKTFNQYTFH
jgi:isoleucyl-tRNA synthetase